MRKERKIEKLLTEIKAEKIFDVPLTFIIAQTRNTVLDQILYIWVLFTTSISHQLPSYGTVQDRIRGKVYIEGRATFRGRGPKFRYENSLLLPHLSFFVYSALQLHNKHSFHSMQQTQSVDGRVSVTLYAGFHFHCNLLGSFGFAFAHSSVVLVDFSLKWFSYCLVFWEESHNNRFSSESQAEFYFSSVGATDLNASHTCVRANQLIMTFPVRMSWTSFCVCMLMSGH